jgi:hypothetical protein
VRTVLLVAVALAGCGPQTGTRLAPLEPRTADVGQELEVVLHADADANVAAMSFNSDIADLGTRKLRPSLSSYSGGESIFRWTPLASDVGAHQIEFDATVDGAVASTTLQITVIAGSGGPTFREPVGDGTTLDPTKTPCADVSLLIDDPVATEVALSAGTPFSDNGSVEQQSALSGRLRFCPSAAQQMNGTVYPFTVVAVDGSGARAEKRYTIVLGKLATPPPQAPPANPATTTCNATAPTITTTPHADITTAGNLHIYATVDDPNGVYDATVFWSTDPPANPPDPTTMNPIDMSYLGGGTNSVDFGATIPNPVVADAPGTTATIYYLIRATDAADSVMGCPYNTSFSPAGGTYSFVVKRSTAP